MPVLYYTWASEYQCYIIPGYLDTAMLYLPGYLDTSVIYYTWIIKVTISPRNMNKA